MHFPPITFDGFRGREEALARITRYVDDLTPVMFYRTNDLIHSRRVLWHLEEALPSIIDVYGDRFDVGFARTLALVHDDVEILTGDVSLHKKEQMDPATFGNLTTRENHAIPRMIALYGNDANGYPYGTLLVAAKEKNRLEAQFVSFFDKFDGGGEAWHEVWAGNHCFLRPAGGNDGQKGGYVRRLREFPHTYPSLVQFFAQFPDFLPTSFDFASAAKQGKPHTDTSLQRNSGYPAYERWKKTIMQREGIDILVNQVEFPSSL